MAGMTQPPFVSVVVPVYGDQLGLNRCLSALARQDWPRDALEVLVVDNASNPPMRLRPDHAAFARIVVCRKTGAYAARNTGIREARGEILAFTDADCGPEPQWLREGVAALDRGARSRVVGGEVSLDLLAHPTAVERYQCLVGFQQRQNIETLGFSATANLFVTRAQLDAVGPFMESLMSGGDREWCWRAERAGFPVDYAREVVVRTSPRTSLRSAIRQARRVTGGRFNLERRGLPHARPAGLRPHRSTAAAAKWILMHPELSTLQRAQVFSVAAIIKMAQLIEVVMLKAGMREERR